MGLRRERIQSLAFLLNTIDHLGRAIEPRVRSVAQEIAHRAISYGEKLLGDPALALTLLEEAAASVSDALKKNSESHRPEIGDLRSYLFRAYLNRITLARQNQPVLEDATDKEWERYTSQTDDSDLDRRILVKELLAHYGTVTQEIVYRHLEGYSWSEVEKSCGVPANAARLRFRKVLQHLQKVLRARGQLK